MGHSIHSVARLVTVIQSQLAPRVQSAQRRPVAAQGRRAGASAYDNENLGRLIEMRIRQIGRDDPQRGRKAFRVFLEAVLLAHLGENLVNDPRFYQMLDDVQNTMEADPDCRQLIGAAIDHLLVGA